jgi:hypothetical protein
MAKETRKSINAHRIEIEKKFSTQFLDSTVLLSKKGFEYNAVLRTTKPRCKVHWVRRELCIPRPPAGIDQLMHKVCADRESNPETPESQRLDTAKHSC